MTWDSAAVITGGICTLAIFSYLWRENSLYRIFEHFFIGLAAGLGPVLVVRDFLWPKVFAPLFGYTMAIYPDGTVAVPYDSTALWFVFPLVFGALYYTIFFKQYSWMARLVIGFSLGISAGLTFKGWFVEMIPQFSSSLKPLIVFDTNGNFLIGQSLSHVVFVTTLLSVLSYFFFSFRMESRVRRGSAILGRWLMMICFGAFFGSTVMARMALLVERVQFLLFDWYQAVAGMI